MLALRPIGCVIWAHCSFRQNQSCGYPERWPPRKKKKVACEELSIACGIEWRYNTVVIAIIIFISDLICVAEGQL